MKKINLSEAENIVGGTLFVPRNLLGGQWQQPYLPAGETCANKFGGVQKFYYPAPVASCPSNNYAKLMRVDHLHLDWRWAGEAAFTNPPDTGREVIFTFSLFTVLTLFHIHPAG